MENALPHPSASPTRCRCRPQPPPSCIAPRPPCCRRTAAAAPAPPGAPSHTAVTLVLLFKLNFRIFSWRPQEYQGQSSRVVHRCVTREQSGGVVRVSGPAAAYASTFPCPAVASMARSGIPATSSWKVRLFLFVVVPKTGMGLSLRELNLRRRAGTRGARVRNVSAKRLLQALGGRRLRRWRGAKVCRPRHHVCPAGISQKRARSVSIVKRTRSPGKCAPLSRRD